jgi:hypothetical protein
MKVREMLIRPFGRIIRDAALGAAIFATLVTAAGNASTATGGFFSGAQAAALAQRSSASVSSQALGADGRLEILVMLAISFMMLFALNIAFVRHLRQAHIAPNVPTPATDVTPN